MQMRRARSRAHFSQRRREVGHPAIKTKSRSPPSRIEREKDGASGGNRETCVS